MKTEIHVFENCIFNTLFVGSSKFRREKEKEVYNNKTNSMSDIQSSKGKFLHALSSLKVLLTNPTFIFLNLAAGTEGIL